MPSLRSLAQTHTAGGTPIPASVQAAAEEGEGSLRDQAKARQAGGTTTTTTAPPPLNPGASTAPITLTAPAPAPVMADESALIEGEVIPEAAPIETQNPLDAFMIEGETGTVKPMTIEEKEEFDEGAAVFDEMASGGEDAELPTYEEHPEKVSAVAAFIARLHHYGVTKNDQDTLDAATNAYILMKDVIPQEIAHRNKLHEIVLPEVEEGEEGLFQRAMGTVSRVPGADFLGRNVVMPAIRFADSASQGTLAMGAATWDGDFAEGVQAFSQGVTYGAVENMIDFALEGETDGGRGVLQSLQEKYDTNGDGTLNFRESLHIDGNTGGRWLGLVDTIMVAIFDPFTWVGLGAAGRARAGLTAVAATQGDDVARAVAREGSEEILDRAAQREVEAYAREAIAKAQTARKNKFWQQANIPDGVAIQTQLDEVLTSIQPGVGVMRLGTKNVRIPGFDAAIYRMRPGYGSQATRGVRSEAVRRAESAEEALPDEVVGSFLDAQGKAISKEQIGAEPMARFAFRGQNMEIPEADARILSLAAEVGDDPARARELFEEMGRVNGQTADEIAEDIAQVERLAEAQDLERLDTSLGYNIENIDPDALATVLTHQPDSYLRSIMPDGFDYRDFDAVQGYETILDADVVTSAVSDAERFARQELDDGTKVLLVKNADGRVDGSLTYDPNTGAIDSVQVRPEARADGLGDELLDELANDLGGIEAVGDAIAKSTFTDAGRGLAQSYLRRRGLANLEIVDGGARLGTKLGKTKAGTWTNRNFRPRGELGAQLDDYAEQVFDVGRVGADAAVSANMEDLFHRIGPLADKAAKAAGSMDEADRIVLKYLESKSIAGVSSGITSLRKRGLNELADYLKASSKLRRHIDEHAIKGGMNPEHMRKGYFPRILTEQGREEVLKSDEIMKRMGLDKDLLAGAQGRFEQPRTWMPDAGIHEANDELVKILELPEGTKLFEDNVIAGYASRGEAAYRASAELDFMKGLAAEKVGTGADRRALMLNIAEGDKVPKGYTRVSQVSGDWYALTDVKDEIVKLRKVLNDNEAMAGMRNFFNEWSKTWGAYATAPLIDGFGFHSRNGVGNVMLNFLAGVVNPAHYTRAATIQANMAKVFNRMGKDGIGFDEALTVMKVSDKDQAMMRMLRDNGIVDKGWFDELSPTTHLAKPRDAKGYDGAWDFLQNNVMINKSRQFGTAVEHNARIAHFVGRIGAGDTVDEAARSVRKFLFDYGDLTATESALKNISRFYTFARKNLGAQLWALSRTPGRVNAIQRATGGPGGVGSQLGQTLGLPGQPDYSNERGDSIMDVLGGDRGLVSSIETPFQASIEVFYRPMAEIASLIEGEGATGADVVRSMMGIVSGGQPAFVDAVYTQITGYNAAFDREMTPEEKGSEGTARRWFDSIIGPAWSQFDTALERLTEGEGVGPLGNNPSGTSEEFGQEMFVLANIMGLNTARMDPEGEQDKDNMFLLEEELQNRLNMLEERDGVPVPTVEDLQNAGFLVPPEDGPDRAKSVVTQERIDELEAMGLDTTMQEAELAERLETEAASGVIIDPETGVGTTREQRTKDLAAENGIYVMDDDGNPKLDDDGEPIPSTRKIALILWNQQNPDDPHLKDDGTPYTYRDANVVWDRTPEGEAMDWLRSQGVTKDGKPLTERQGMTKELQRIFNERSGMAPYYEPKQLVEMGQRPIEGVYTGTDDRGTEFELWPAGMSEDNWWYGDKDSQPEPQSESGTSALVPQELPSLDGIGALSP